MGRCVLYLSHPISHAWQAVIMWICRPIIYLSIHVWGPDWARCLTTCENVFINEILPPVSQMCHEGSSFRNPTHTDHVASAPLLPPHMRWEDGHIIRRTEERERIEGPPLTRAMFIWNTMWLLLMISNMTIYFVGKPAAYLNAITGPLQPPFRRSYRGLEPLYVNLSLT